MDKFDRIYALHGLLSRSRHPVSMAKILEELECAKATAKRIIEHMRLFLDAPITYQREHNGYVYDTQSEHPFELPGIWFNTSELHALLTA
ncbi:MAG: transcriptional regulator, partial [Gammaproteobacteria bacterium]|nr:transcriptional regulator [Gammaproteobacteria bacterium]